MATIAKFWHKEMLINLAYPYYCALQKKLVMLFVWVL